MSYLSNQCKSNLETFFPEYTSVSDLEESYNFDKTMKFIIMQNICIAKGINFTAPQNLSGDIRLKEGNHDFFIDIDDTICSRDYGVFSVNIMDNDHFIFAGLKELIQFLLDIKDSRIIFYSAGLPERNTQLIRYLLDYWGLSDFSGVRILVYSHVLITDPLDKNFIPDLEIFYNRACMGTKKKRISDIARDMNYAILIDDDVSYCTKGEEFNFVTFLPRPSNDSGYSVNGLFRIAGLIYAYLQCERLSLVQFMRLALAYDHISNNELYYSCGLKILQRYNPKLVFDEYVSPPITNVPPPIINIPPSITNIPNDMKRASINEALITTWFPNKSTILLNDTRYESNGGKLVHFSIHRKVDIYYDDNIYDYNEKTGELIHLKFPQFCISLHGNVIIWKISFPGDKIQDIVDRLYAIADLMIRENVVISGIFYQLGTHSIIRESSICALNFTPPNVGQFFFDNCIYVTMSDTIILIRMSPDYMIKLTEEHSNHRFRFDVYQKNKLDTIFYCMYLKFVCNKGDYYLRFGDISHF